MKNLLLFCAAYWAERFFDWAIVTVNRLDVWLEKRKSQEIEESRSRLEQQFHRNNSHREEKEL